MTCALVRNPFMLWALAQSWAALPEGELPTNTGELYLAFIEDYIFSRREPEKDPPPTRYDFAMVKRYVLAQLAYQMTSEAETRIVRDNALEDTLLDWLEAIEQTNRRRRVVMPTDWTVDDFLSETVLNGVLRRVGDTLEF